MSPMWSFLMTLAYCAPVLVLVLPLLARRYVGEQALVRRVRRRAPRRKPVADAPPPSAWIGARVPSGGALLSAWLAGRAPPRFRPTTTRSESQKEISMQTKTTIAALAAATVLAVPATAHAHVTLKPDEAPAGGFTRLDVRVPNEEPDRGTTKVQVQMPPGFAFVSYEAVPGWKVRVQKEKLDKPITAGHGEKITEQVSRVTWTGDGKTGIVRPGEFRDFGLSVGVPEGKPGKKLTFKALQTYQGGKIVRWIGAPDSDKPAPQVTLTAGNETADTAPAKATASTGDSDDDGPSTGLVIVALVLGAAGLVTGVASMARSRSVKTQ